MNKEQKPARSILSQSLRRFGGRFAPTTQARQVGKTGAFPSTRGRKMTRRKLQKTESLWVFHFDPAWPFFRQAWDGRKRETLWVM